MPKLSQILAVEDDLRQKATSIGQEAKKTFTSKSDHFDGITKTYTAFVEGGNQIPPETKEIVSTVKDKIDFTMAPIIASIDARATISETNASGAASAELIVGSKSFGTFAATSLLELEKTLVVVRGIYGDLPTLDPAKKWEDNSKSIPNTFATPVQVSFRSEKSKKTITLSPATDKFPANVQVYDDEQQVGQYNTTYLSGKITPAQKSELLGNIDALILAVKDARTRANACEAKVVTIGKALVDFIQNGVI